jgi:hypothetical protein
MFVLKGGISTTQSPSEIILNRKLDFNAHCKVEFGDYVQTHEEHDNTMAAHTVGAIATRPTGNAHGGYYFIRLDTGRQINRRDWTPLPMPDLVIDQVHRLARRAKANPTLTFTNTRNKDIDELYANIQGINDDDDPIAGPAGVEGNTAEDSDDENDEDYVPTNDIDDEDSSDSSDSDDSENSDDDDGETDDDNDDQPDESAGVMHKMAKSQEWMTKSKLQERTTHQLKRPQ